MYSCVEVAVEEIKWSDRAPEWRERERWLYMVVEILMTFTNNEDGRVTMRERWMNMVVDKLITLLNNEDMKWPSWWSLPGCLSDRLEFLITRTCCLDHGHGGEIGHFQWSLTCKAVAALYSSWIGADWWTSFWWCLATHRNRCYGVKIKHQRRWFNIAKC